MSFQLGEEEIKKRFGKHSAAIEGPNPKEQEHAYVRALFVYVATNLDEVLPAGRAKNVAFTELETASMWAHKALAE